MYSTTILCTIVILVSAAAFKQGVYKLPPEKVLAAKKYSIACEQEHNVDSSFLPKIVDGTLPDNEAAKKYLYCFTLKGKFGEEDGHMIVDRIASFLGDHPLVEDFKEALRNCNKMTKENHLETVMAMNACIHDTAPVIFFF